MIIKNKETGLELELRNEAVHGNQIWGYLEGESRQKHCFRIEEWDVVSPRWEFPSTNNTVVVFENRSSSGRYVDLYPAVLDRHDPDKIRVLTSSGEMIYDRESFENYINNGAWIIQQVIGL